MAPDSERTSGNQYSPACQPIADRSAERRRHDGQRGVATERRRVVIARRGAGQRIEGSTGDGIAARGLSGGAGERS